MSLIDRDVLAAAGRQMELAMASSSSQDRELCSRYVLEANRVVATHLLKSPFAFPFHSFLLASLQLLLTA